MQYTNEFYLLDDNEIAVITSSNISFYDNHLEPHNKEIKNIEWAASSADKNGYEVIC